MVHLASHAGHQASEPVAPRVSVVIPVYNEEGNLDALYARLARVLDRISRPYEVIFVDACSTGSEPGSIFELPEKVNQLELDAGITVPLRTGGRFTVSAPFSQKNALTQIPSDQFLSALRFSISQPLLRDAGHTVVEARDGLEALELGSRLRIDLLLTDLGGRHGAMNVRVEGIAHENGSAHAPCDKLGDIEQLGGKDRL